MARFLSFRFDDGMIVGARKAVALLAPSPASFFVVTGRLCGTVPVDHIDALKGADFGSIGEWRAFAAQGHDVHSHSVSHPDFRKLSNEQQMVEFRDSLAVIRQIHDGPYVFCYPFNSFSSVDPAQFGFSAAGFLTKRSDDRVFYNSLVAGTDPFRLRSWAVRQRHLQSVINQLDRDVPDTTWTILGFHSLDEGFEPWSTEGFAQLVSAVRALDYRIVSIGEMVGRISGARHSGAAERPA